jgi:hypothetical protein
MGNDLTNLTNVLLIAVAGGAILAFGYLASQRVIRSGSYRVWAGAALVAIPGLLLGWMVTQPSLRVQEAYGEISQAILGEEPSPSQPTRTIDPPKAGGRGQVRGTSSAPSLSPTPDQPVAGGPTGGPAPPPTNTSSPPEPTPTESPSPTPSTSPSPTPSPSPTVSPSPSPSPTPVEEAVGAPPPPPPDDTDVLTGNGSGGG